MVEDEPTVRELITEVLEADGLLVVPCARLAEAREQIWHTRFDGAVIDFGLPDGIGSELCLTPWAPRFPHVFLSAWLNRKDRACHPDDVWLEKPFMTSELLDAVRRMLQLHSLGHRPPLPDPI